MRLLHRIQTIVAAMRRSRRHRADFPRWLATRPQLAVGTVVYEAATLACNQVEPRLKTLAEVKTAAMVACEYCLDLGSAMAITDGVSEKQLLDLPRFESSDAYDEEERLVLRLVEAMTATPSVVPDELRERAARAVLTTRS